MGSVIPPFVHRAIAVWTTHHWPLWTDPFMPRIVDNVASFQADSPIAATNARWNHSATGRARAAWLLTISGLP